MKSNVATYYGCKRARHGGVIANGHSQANRDYSCVRNMNCCFAHCAANMAPETEVGTPRLDTRLSCLHTGGMFTANTMSSIVETLGMTLPGDCRPHVSAVNPGDEEVI